MHHVKQKSEGIFGARPDGVAAEGAVGIGRIIDPGQVLSEQQLPQCRTRHLQQWSDYRWLLHSRHSRRIFTCSW